MGISLTQLILIVIIILILFGAGKLPNVMSEIGKGLNSFKKALKDDKADSEDKENNPKDKGDKS